MDKTDLPWEPDDGIVSEDLTQLVEHIELASAQRLASGPEWELAQPAGEHDDAPILLQDLGDDPERFTATEFDLTRRLRAESREPEISNELAAERLRWQRRVEKLQLEIEERDHAIADRDRRIGDLEARLAATTLERDGFETGLHDTRVLAASLDAEMHAPEPRRAPEAEADETRSVPALAPPAEPRVRRYLIGLDLAGSVLEIARSRVNVGRTVDNDLRIVDPTVSRLHAMLTVRGSEVMLTDANSRNGIFVNGIQVRYARLEDGDLVTFGTVRYRYRVGSTGASESTGAA